MGKILEGELVCKILEQCGQEQGGACLVPFNIIKGFIGRISFPLLCWVFPHCSNEENYGFPHLHPGFPPDLLGFPPDSLLDFLNENGTNGTLKRSGTMRVRARAVCDSVCDISYVVFVVLCIDFQKQISGTKKLPCCKRRATKLCNQ